MSVITLSLLNWRVRIYHRFIQEDASVKIVNADKIVKNIVLAFIFLEYINILEY